VLTEVLLVLPRCVAKGTLGTIDEIKPFLDERPSLQGGKKGGIRLQFREISSDCRRFYSCEIRKSLRCIGKCVEISEGCLLVELGRLCGR